MSPITLPIAELKPALTGLGKVLNRHSALPILSHVKIERAPDGWVALTATDLDHSVTVRLEQPSAGEPLGLLVPYDELLKISKTRNKDEDIFLEATAPNAALLRSKIGEQFAETRIACLPVEEFPVLPNIQGVSIPVDASLRSAIHEALECASEDETRLILNGAFLDVSKPKAHYVVGTDGRHLFASNSFALPLQESLFIPSHRFLEWKEFNVDGEWQLQVGPKGKDEDDPPPFAICSRRWRFISRQDPGNYPNWRQVVPGGESTQTTIEIEPASVEAIVQTIARMPEHDSVHHALGLEAKDSQVRILGKSAPEDAWTRIEVPGAKAKGQDVIIKLNRHLLAKALRFGLTRIEIIDPLSPLKFSQGGRQMIVMPVRPDAESESTAPESVPANSPEANPPPAAEQPKGEPMANETTPNGSAKFTEPLSIDAQFDLLIGDVETMRTAAQDHLTEINGVRTKLKALQREHRSSIKEVQSVRQTLRTLQSVRI